MTVCSYCKYRILDISDTIEYEDGPCHIMCHMYNTWLAEYLEKLNKGEEKLK